jgi:hypothetical protein
MEYSNFIENNEDIKEFFNVDEDTAEEIGDLVRSYRIENS